MAGRVRRVLASFGIAVLMTTMSVVAQAGETPLPPGTTRMAGENRYETSAAVSAKSFTAPVAAVFVATGDSYPDALAGGPAAARLGGPVLLVKSQTIPAGVKAELTRLRPSTIYVLGGRNVISGALAEELKKYAGNVTRLSGEDRYATAVAASQAGWGSASTVFLASGAGFADALSGGAAAASKDSPLLLTPSNKLSSATRAELQRLAPQRVYILGGQAAVSDVVINGLRSAVPNATLTRAAGADRYATSAEVARRIWPKGAGTAFFANGSDFPDALSGTPAAAVNNAPLILTKRDCLPGAAYAVRAEFGPTSTGVLGGSAVLKTSGATQECGSYRYSGSGDDVLTISKPGGKENAAIVTLTHEGSSNFAIVSRGEELEYHDLLVNEIGDYRGRVLLDPPSFDGPVTSRYLDITADGSWVVEIRSLGSARPMSKNKTTGASADVLSWSGSPAVVKFTHDGSSNFAVIAREADGDYGRLLINDIGPYSGTVAIPSGMGLIEIIADGGWSTTVQ